MNKKGENRRILEQTLDALSRQKSAPKGGFIALLLLYFAATAIVSASAGSQNAIMIAGNAIPLHTFAGVFSSFAHICVILMAVYYGKGGSFTALALLLIHLPMIVGGIVLKHNINSIPGVFGSLLAIAAVVIIYFSNEKIGKYQAVLRDQAVTDLLTGLPNGFAATELIAALIKKEERFTAVSIDLNGFKSINDTMGFDAGNDVLIEIAKRWKAIADTGSSGTMDFISRLNGDEFSLVIRRYQSEEQVLNTIRQYEAALDERLTVRGCDFYVSASFGYAEYPTDTDNLDSVVSYAVTAMQEIKAAGGDSHILRFSQDLLCDDHTLEMEGRIRDALKNDTVFFQLQPQYDMSHKLRGFEALARMRDEQGNIISPVEFIPVAEKVGLIDQVDGAVYRKSAAFVGELIRKYGADITLSINVSVRHLMKSDFLDEVRELIESSGIPAEHLEIEITESIMIESMDKAIHCIEEIRKMGIQIAIDDFGTGYSSLSYLNSFPANLLKIDKSFIDQMNMSDSSRQYVAAIISIGHILGFDVISEGVEEEDQLTTLREIGCDYVQGYIWGRPLPEEEAEQVLRESVQQA